MKFAVAAGFPYKASLSSTVREMKALPGYTSFEGLGSTHPTWEERLALLDRKQQDLWSAMGAFRNGWFFLNFEQYLSAEQCFQGVVKEFPDCYEGWANLGYAKLMRYCDGLDADDLARLGLGKIAAGAFYARPKSLESKVRGIDEKLWQSAVKTLKKALALKPDLVLPRANLGLAYLVHPEGRDAEQASKWFAEALAGVKKDPELRSNPLAGAAVLMNSAVADLAMDKLADAARKLKSIRRLGLDLPDTPVESALMDAYVYNLSLVAERDEDAKEKRRAAQMLGDYLLHASPDSAYWSLAKARHDRLVKALGVKDVKLPRLRGEPGLRLVTAITADGETISLSQPLKEIMPGLGQGIAIPLSPQSKIARWRFPGGAVELLGKDKILAIFLRTREAPPVVVKALGVGAKGRELRVGMAQKEALEVLKIRGGGRIERAIDDPDVRFQFYPELGLAVRYDDGRVAELALAQVPRWSLEKERWPKKGMEEEKGE
jgi:tetratricopeptide (TPR) repeat protein